MIQGHGISAAVRQFSQEQNRESWQLISLKLADHMGREHDAKKLLNSMQKMFTASPLTCFCYVLPAHDKQKECLPGVPTVPSTVMPNTRRRKGDTTHSAAQRRTSDDFVRLPIYDEGSSGGDCELLYFSNAAMCTRNSSTLQTGRDSKKSTPVLSFSIIHRSGLCCR